MPLRERRRVEMMAWSVPNGPAILDLIRSPDVRKLLIAAADSGIVPSTAVSARLIDQFGAKAVTGRATKQFVGLAIASVLAEEGFVALRTGVRTRADPLFTRGATYTRRVSHYETDRRDLLERFLESLTDEEAEKAADYLSRRLK